MNWIELKKVTIGPDRIYLFSCAPTESAYKVRDYLRRIRPNVTVIYCGELRRLREYQVSHWLHYHAGQGFRDYTLDPEATMTLRAMESFNSALRQIELRHGYYPTEIVIVRH